MARIRKGPQLQGYVVVSTLDPDKLSLRAHPHHATATPLKLALKESGFLAGDLVNIVWQAHDVSLESEEE